MRSAAAIWMFTLAAAGQVLTLSEAEQLALRNSPRLGSANLLAGAANSVVVQARSAYYPQLSASVTGADAERGTVIGAGTLTTSSLYSRIGAGAYLNQLVTDFGRTGSLTQSAQLRADAQGKTVDFTRAQIRLRVRQAYYRALQSQAVLTVAQQTVANRQLTARRVSALAESQLKSTLDVRFADVNVSEAQLTLYRAENDQRATRAELSAALGSGADLAFDLADEPLPPTLEPDIGRLIAGSLSERPDLANARLNRDAAQRFADAERRLRLPAVNVLGAAGALPAHDDRIHGNYSAAGVNVSIPIFNGRAFSARYTEAEFRAQAASKDVQDFEIQIARDVRIAWLNSESAFRRLDVAAKLVVQASEALRLAQSRYELGLSSIVELSQAELSKTSADFENATARYDYQLQRAALDYLAGMR